MRKRGRSVVEGEEGGTIVLKEISALVLEGTGDETGLREPRLVGEVDVREELIVVETSLLGDGGKVSDDGLLEVGVLAEGIGDDHGARDLIRDSDAVLLGPTKGGSDLRDDGADDVRSLGVSVDEDVGDVGGVGVDVLETLGGDVLSSVELEDVLDTADDAQRAVGVPSSDVSSVEPDLSVLFDTEVLSTASHQKNQQPAIRGQDDGFRMLIFWLGKKKKKRMEGEMGRTNVLSGIL